MTARPQENVVNNIALLPDLDEWLRGCPDPSKVSPEWLVKKPSRLLWRCRDALASAQAREEELWAEVERLTGVVRGMANEIADRRHRAERLAEVIKNVLRYRKGEGDYNFSHLTGQARDMAVLESWEQLELYMERLLSNEA